MLNMVIKRDGYVSVSHSCGVTVVPMSEISECYMHIIRDFEHLPFIAMLACIRTGTHDINTWLTHLGHPLKDIHGVYVEDRKHYIGYLEDADAGVRTKNVGPSTDAEHIQNLLLELRDRILSNIAVGYDPYSVPDGPDVPTDGPEHVNTHPKFYAADYSLYGRDCSCSVDGIVRMAWGVSMFSTKKERDVYVNNRAPLRIAVPANRITVKVNCGHTTLHVTPKNAKKIKGLYDENTQ